MSTPSSKRLNPTLLIVVGILVLAAIGFGVMKVLEAPKEKAATETASVKQSRKSSRTTGGTYSESAALHGTKSEGMREGSRPDPSAVRNYSSGGEDMYVQISVDAREELKLLREKSATRYDDPDERRAFGERLAGITDVEERQRVLRERTEQMRQARAKADAEKSVEDREREKQLIVLMQVQNLWRMAEFVAKNPNLKREADTFNTSLSEWVQGVGQMDTATFHSSFNTLRDSLNDLRRRNAQTAHPESVRENLPSNRPERNGS